MQRINKFLKSIQTDGFDFGSIMLYSLKVFSNDGKSPTITKHDGSEFNTQRVNLSDQDIEMIDVMYSNIGIMCQNLKLTTNKYSEKENLEQIVKAEYGNDFVVADWNDLKSMSDIQEWIDCMNLQENQTFIVTKNGYNFYGSSRQYYVHYSSDGVPFGSFLVHDQIAGLYLGSWYGLNMKILAKKKSTN